MYKNKTFLAIIPARHGSKGLANKNIKELCGKPLIAWSIKSGLDSKYIDEVMVTTDSEKIANIAKQYGANVPFLRPKKLASDTATTFSAVKHAVEFYKNNFQKEFDYIILLEPTSPLREKNDIDNMIKQVVHKEHIADSIISIGEVHEHPSIMKKINSNDSIVAYCENIKITTRRQDNDAAYFPYGVAYISKKESLYKEKTFYTKKNTYYKIKRHQCYEIDDIYDFLSIEKIMEYRGMF